MGHTRCPRCFLEVWHTQHRTSKSSRQKSLRTSSCVLHFKSTVTACFPVSPAPVPAVAPLHPCSFRKVSATFFRAKLTVGSVSEHFLLQTGHSRLAFFLFQNCWRQGRQKLWLHLSTTGSLKISQHIGQESSSSSMEPDCDETARGRRGEFSLELWKKVSFKGWEEARGRNAMVLDVGCVGGGAAVCKEEVPCRESREQSGHSLWATKVIEQQGLEELVYLACSKYRTCHHPSFVSLREA